MARGIIRSGKGISVTRPGSTQRGYGARHKALRKQLLPHAVGRACSRCGKPMEAGQALHLDHTDDRRGYKGFAHAECNDRAAGFKAAAMLHPQNPQPRSNTKW